MSQPKKYLTVGMVGLGSMGQNHVRIASNHPMVGTVHIFDMDRVRAENTGQKFDCLIASSFEDLLSKVEVEVHCLIEKPITATIDEAEQLVALAAETGCTVVVGHVERYNPVYSELSKILKSEKIFAVTAERLSYNLSRANDVSVVYDLMIHDLDTILHIAESALTVEHASNAAFHSRDLDFSTAVLRDGDGIIYNVTASKVSQTRSRKLHVSCEGCLIEADYLRKEIQILRNSSGKYLERSQEIGYRQEALVERVMVPNSEPLLAEHTDFYSSIQNGTAPKVTARDGLRAIQLADAIEKASPKR